MNGFNQATENNASGGVMRFRGTVSEPSAITLAGVAASVTGSNWQAAAPVSAGPNHLTLQATETSGVPANTNAQTTVRHLDFTLNANKGFDYTYDAEGNETARAGRQTFEWDAANRLVAINYPGTTQRSEFTYDGLSRRVKMIEKTGATVTSERRYLWDGMAITEERDASNAVTRRFFAEGEQILTAPALNLFSERDHLGSVRALRDSTGTLRARYDYDPYGIRTKLAGDLEAATGYTGHWHHAPSGLALAPYRAYDPELGRWLSRDPNGEEGGLNLYGYVDNDPINAVDPLGWEAEIQIVRQSRTSSTQVIIRENGNIIGGYFGNSNEDGVRGTSGLLSSDYTANRQGPPDGSYSLIGKDNFEPGDAFMKGVPSITGKNSPVGSPGPGFPAVYRMHINGLSRGCQTSPDPWPDFVWDVMDRNKDNGGTKVVITTQSVPKAVPFFRRTPKPPRHKFFNQ